jgi:hypothetical protein
MCDSSQSGLVNVSQQSLSASLAVPHQNLEDREGGRLTRNKLPPPIPNTTLVVAREAGQLNSQ